MQIVKVGIKNFRLLKDVELCFQKETTVIVGRNNSGKTSLAEFFKRLLAKESPLSFELEDFSLCVHEQFWDAYRVFEQQGDDASVRMAMPIIEASITLSYQKDAPLLGALTDFIIDINPDCTEVRANIRYQPADGKARAFFDKIELKGKDEAERKHSFFKIMRARIPVCYSATLLAVDPRDDTNTKAVEWARFRALLQTGFINAHRGLDDTTHRDNDVLGKILEALFKAAQSETATQNDKDTAKGLEAAVETIQGNIAEGFSAQLKKLLPAFKLFGYPRLKDPDLRTETAFDVERLLKDHTKIQYSGANGVHLPEAYNGLGTRNLIFMLLKLLGFFKEFQSGQSIPAVHLVFIEEPEAHLHPQMQEVFISKLGEIAAEFSKQYNEGKPWPVQFVVTTHSSHLANKAPFKAIRYFLAAPDAGGGLQTKIKDLGDGFGKALKPDDEFLHKYMTLTRCDLMFADKAILIEGTTERILMPKMIADVDASLPPDSRLGSQYLCVMEVGGAYAHRFFKLLDFLELRTLIITDLDSVKPGAKGKLVSCKVGEATRSSNGCIKDWFKPQSAEQQPADPVAPLTMADIRAKTDSEKTVGLRRLAYQIPESAEKPTGRSFEGAFMLANPKLFGLAEDATAPALEQGAWDEAEAVDSKSDFALRFAIDEGGWLVPRYIREGLVWLAGDATAPAAPPAPVADSNATPAITPTNA